MLPILLIGGWYKPENKKENSYFNGYKPWTLFNTLKKSINHIFTFINNNQDDLKKIFLKDFEGIDSVCIGDSSYPVTTIKFKKGE